jgi:oligopeptide/dipeptide ABC transporter ATP-binding protein
MTGTELAKPRRDKTGAGSGAMLRADDLVRHFSIVVRGQSRTVRAVDGVSLELREGRCLGLVGESGCGKTTTGRMVAGLDQPSSGHVQLDNTSLRSARGRVDKAARRRVQMIFQDPQSSLDPRMTVAQSVGEPLRVSGVSRRDTARRVSALLTRVGLDDEVGQRRPSALSGGQRQRVGIARALALEPAFIVADEPTSALDVSVRAQVVNLLRDLQRELGLGMVFISHDLSTVRYLCDEVAVMYLGRIVEQGPTDVVFGDPQHPYTRALLEAVLTPDPVVEQARSTVPLQGDLPTSDSAPSGCAFRTRCRMAAELCSQERPLLLTTGAHRFAACHFADRSAS